MIKTSNRRLETKVLIWAMRSKFTAARLFEQLRPEHFSSQAFVETFTYLRSSFTDGRFVTYEAFKNDPDVPLIVRTKILEFGNDVKKPSPDTVEASIRILDKYKKTRALVKAVEKINTGLSQETADVDAVLSESIRNLEGIISEEEKASYIDVADDPESAVSFLEEDNDASFIQTGFNAWDKVNHGYIKGNVVLIGGYTGSGKSALAQNIFSNAAMAGHKAHFISLEMTKSQLDQRDAARICKVSLNKLLRPSQLDSTTKEEVKRKVVSHNKKIKANGGVKRYYVPKDDIETSSVFSILASEDFDLLVIDYISLFKDSAGSENRAQWQMLNDIVRKFKRFAVKRNAVIIILVQVSDEGVLTLSKAMKTHADVLHIVRRHPEDKSLFMVDTTKARMQQDISFALKFIGEFCSLEDTDKKAPAPQQKTKSKLPPRQNFGTVE